MSPRARPQSDKNGSGTAKRQKKSFAPQKSAPNAARFFIKPYLNNARECAKDMAAFNILKFIPFVGISLWATHGLWETLETYQRCALAALIRPFPRFSQIIPFTRRKKNFQSVPCNAFALCLPDCGNFIRGMGDGARSAKFICPARFRRGWRRRFPTLFRARFRETPAALQSRLQNSRRATRPPSRTPWIRPQSLSPSK